MLNVNTLHVFHVYVLDQLVGAFSNIRLAGEVARARHGSVFYRGTELDPKEYYKVAGA